MPRGVDPSGLLLRVIDAGFEDVSNRVGLCWSYRWFQLVDLAWLGFANDEIAHYGTIDVFGVFMRTGVWLQHVRHSYLCISCLPINISGDHVDFWEWFALDHRRDHPVPGTSVVGPFEFRYYGRDTHWMNYQPPVVSSPQNCVCVSKVRVTSYLGAVLGVRRGEGFGILEFPPPSLPNHFFPDVPRVGVGFPLTPGYEWGFDVRCVSGKCERVSKFGF